MQEVEYTRGNFSISTDKTRLDLAAIHDFLCNSSYWAEGIPLALVKKSIENSLCFGIFEGPKQVGFARVISDLATFAYLGDVFVIEAYRGQGLSKWLLECIMGHPELQGLRNWLLLTRDAHGLYRRFGFQAPSNPEKILQIRHSGIYYLTIA